MDGSIARPRPFLALGVRLLAAAALATMAMLVKLSSERGVHLGELLFWRQATTLVVAASLIAFTRGPGAVRTRRLGAHFRRAISGIVCMCFVYGSLILLPLAEATVLSFTTPLFAVLLSVILFNEKVGHYRWGAVLLGFAGVAIIVQPGSATIAPAGLATGLIAGAMVAWVSFQVQDLNTSERPLGIVFWFAALTTPILALLLPLFWTSHDLTTWLVVGAVGVSGTIAQLLLTASLRFGSAATIIVMDYTALLWATFYGWSIFERLPPPALWLGAPLIIAAGLLIAWRERVLAHERHSAAAGPV